LCIITKLLVNDRSFCFKYSCYKKLGFLSREVDLLNYIKIKKLIINSQFCILINDEYYKTFNYNIRTKYAFKALRILIFTFINISNIKIIEAFESDNIRFDQLDSRNSRNNRYWYHITMKYYPTIIRKISRINRSTKPILSK